MLITPEFGDTLRDTMDEPILDRGTITPATRWRAPRVASRNRGGACFRAAERLRAGNEFAGVVTRKRRQSVG
jgi:hypothetical protein